MKSPNTGKWRRAINAVCDEEREKGYRDKHWEVANQLDKFLSGEQGAMAKTLLAKTRKFVVVARFDDGDGFVVALLLDEEGLKSVLEATATSYSERPPTKNPMTSIEFVKKAIEFGIKPDEILPFIFRMIDEIADEAMAMKSKGKTEDLWER